MKNSTFILTFLIWAASGTVFGQTSVAILDQNGISQAFYGLNSFAEAMDSSATGDHIYLSAGYFTPPVAISKGVKVYGAGHFPVEGKQTIIQGGLSIMKGADSLKLEGLYIDGDINYDANNSITNVRVVRCGVISVNFQSISVSASKNYFSYEECFIRGNIRFSRFGNNFILRNSIITGFVSNIDGNALIDGNIFLNSGWFLDPYTNYVFVISNVKYSIIQNNIFLKSAYVRLFEAITGTTINKNLFEAPGFGTYGYSGIARSEIFVNQSGDVISYSQDYHLKSPATYIGTNGSQVGLYGGLGFKENGLPSNPIVVSKTIAPSTDASGNLQISITVKAQDN
jgi:hypothetical protein